ncbi:MAG: type I secretion system permease/ATPase [Hyphomicrobiales bacterium]|uniref:type I secretion system permease/ATPase n=1 Tax=Rhabdaerophilum calidifontis TaxID=2604328 RepID=UPI002482D483|nr:type I secretion system permease/ATPase [Rhabdaerophilum calidifontis]MCA1951459.1 type I secretion system permease/ATPase [Hyphomicrobiales bacterium]
MNLKRDHFLWIELRPFIPAFSGLMFFSGIIALLFLVPSLYMHQIFERVMQSRNLSTLTALAAIVVFLTIIWTALDLIRIKTLQRVAYAFDERVSERVFDSLNRQTDTLSAAARATLLQDLNTIRDFLGGTLIASLMDLAFVPLVILAGFLFHPYLGLLMLALVLLIGFLAVMSQIRSRDDMRRSIEASANAAEFGRAVMRSAEAVRPLGMLPDLVERWRRVQRDAIGWQYGATRQADPFNRILVFIRHLQGPIVVTVGALLFLAELAGPGAMFAAMILAGRAVAPVSAIANSWRTLWGVALSGDRLDAILREAAKKQDRVELPVPAGPLVVSRVSAAPRNRDAMTLTDVSFSLAPGQILAVVGASGAGKSTLARVLVGAWPVRRGSITLDGHELSHWDQDKLGRHIGYVAQDVEMLPGTIGENIARFQPRTPETVRQLIDAVRTAGVQDIIAKLPDGFNTRMGPDGIALSSGQCQRIALARAIYGEPRLLVLDEPNSNLDAAGEQMLVATLTKLKNTGSIIVLITHRMNMLAYCDQVLVMNNGTVQAFGPREQVMNRLSPSRPKELTDARGGVAGSVSSAAE